MLSMGFESTPSSSLFFFLLLFFVLYAFTSGPLASHLVTPPTPMYVSVGVCLCMYVCVFVCVCAEEDSRCPAL